MSHNWDPSSSVKIVDCGHWALRKGSIVVVYDNINRTVILSSFISLISSLSLYLFSFSLLSLSLSPSFSFYTLYHLLHSHCDLPACLPCKADHSCWAGAQCVNQYPVHPIITSDWAPADQSVHKWTTALIHSRLSYDKTEPNGFKMSHRLSTDMWKWPISSIKDHCSVCVWRTKTTKCL